MNQHSPLSTSPLGPYETFTASGNRLDFANPQPHMIDRESIAHHLAMLNRWTGNTHFAYSVAQHSLLVANLIHVPEWRIYGLLHDAAEAYTGDLPTPFKHWLQMGGDAGDGSKATNGSANKRAGADVIGLERRILNCIYAKFRIEKPTRGIASAVAAADANALATEYRDVVKGTSEHFQPNGRAHTRTIQFKTGFDVECRFLEALDTYLRLAKAM